MLELGRFLKKFKRMPKSKKKSEDFSSGFLFFVNEELKILRIFLLTLFSQVDPPAYRFLRQLKNYLS